MNYPRRIESRVKRLVDVVISLAALLVLWPLMLAVAMVVRLALGAPVFFCQTRAGLRGAPFRMCKFRTMRDARDTRGHLLPDERRLTRLGRFLRATSLDELPELLTVLRGPMSLVGPRPLLTQYVDRYTPAQARRLEIKPGITGWAQIHGRNSISWQDKFALDVWYVDHRTLRLDFGVLLVTVWKVIRCDGVSAAPTGAMTEFTGSAVPQKETA